MVTCFFVCLNVCSGIEISDCGRYVILYISKGAEPRSKIYYCDLEKIGGEVKGMIQNRVDALYLVALGRDLLGLEIGVQ